MIFSGGLDSSTLLYYLLERRKYDEIHCLSFNYGQRHSKELEYAKKIIEVTCKRFPEKKIIHKIIDISTIHELIAKGALTGEDALPQGEMYTSENQKKTIVPNRNMILLSIGAGYAIKIGAKKVFYGAHSSDYSVYPDCRPEFVKVLNAALFVGNIWTPVEVEAPFVHMTKADIVKLGLELKIPYQYTWTCYKGGERPCLKCAACLERTEAFMKNNIRDPALTPEEWIEALKQYHLVTMNK